MDILLKAAEIYVEVAFMLVALTSFALFLFD